MADLITIKLTPEEADLVRRNVDGWLDAGACKGGLSEAENEALWKVMDQIRSGEKRLARRGKEPSHG